MVASEPPLNTTQVDPIIPLNRAHAITYTLALIFFFYTHLSHLLSSSSVTTLLSLSLLVADAVLAFMWALMQATRWRPIRRQVYPERLVEKSDLPKLDIFVCTADPDKEPPLGVANTILSVLSYEYPSEKLSVFVSDDGGSELSLFAFMEAARFARYWVPFCRENGVKERSPEAYFQAVGSANHSEKIKILYEKMKDKIEQVMEKGRVDENLLISEEERLAFKHWRTTGFTRRDHPPVVQVLLESGKDIDISDRPLPNLVYVSREKNKASPHHFKAGALNVLLRVSSVMSDAPFILTLDCDMVSNDPNGPYNALCFFLDERMAKDLAFVQFPQRFGNPNKNDLYASEIRRLFRIHPLGFDGVGGSSYVGSGAFFNRRALHGEKDVMGGSRLSGAHVVAGCTYENGTGWGSTVGFRYGSLVEDYYTGYMLQCEGWNSVFYDPERPAFLGDVPVTLQDVLGQATRWTVGLFEVAFSKHSPITFGVTKASLLLGMCYSIYAFWGLWSIPVIIYGFVPQLALINNLPIFPKVGEARFMLYLYLFLASYLQDLVEFLRSGGSMIGWWNDQRMWLIRGVTCYPLGLVEFTLKHMGIASVGFTVTSKATDEDKDKLYQEGQFDFGVESPFMFSLASFALLSFVALVVGVGRVVVGASTVGEFGVQLGIAGFVVGNCWPVYEAMVLRNDSGKMPTKCTVVAVVLAGVLCGMSCFLFSI